MIKTSLITALGGMIVAASIAVAAPAVAAGGHGHGGAAGATSETTSETGGARTTAARNASKPAAAPGVRAAAAVGAPTSETDVRFKAIADAIRSGEINSTRPVAGIDDPGGDPLPAPVDSDNVPFDLPAEFGW